MSFYKKKKKSLKPLAWLENIVLVRSVINLSSKISNS